MVTAENCLLKNAQIRHNSLAELQQNSFQKKGNLGLELTLFPS